jgi:hypothetical protein
MNHVYVSLLEMLSMFTTCNKVNNFMGLNGNNQLTMVLYL